MLRHLLYLTAIVMLGAGCASSTDESRRHDAATAVLVGNYETKQKQRVDEFNREHLALITAQMNELKLLSDQQFNQQLERSARQLSEQIIGDSSTGMILPGSFGDTCYTALLNDYNSLDNIVTNLAAIRQTYAGSSSAINANFSKLDTLKSSLQNLAMKPSQRQEISTFLSLAYKAYQDAQKQAKNAKSGTTGTGSSGSTSTPGKK